MAEATSKRGLADCGLFGQRLTDPAILPLVCADDDYQVATYRIERVKKVCNNAQQTKAARKDDELIFGSKLGEQVLLILLG